MASSFILELDEVDDVTFFEQHDAEDGYSVDYEITQG